jgi:hypothetical protein
VWKRIVKSGERKAHTGMLGLGCWDWDTGMDGMNGIMECRSSQFQVPGSEFRVQSSEFRVSGFPDYGSMLKVQEFRVQASKLKTYGQTVSSSESKVQITKFRVPIPC